MKKFAAQECNSTVQLLADDRKIALAGKWFHMGVGLDGIVAKRDDMPYQTGKRTGMQKIKKQRTADCVVGGFRYLEKKPLVGSLLLGLYDRDGKAKSRRLHIFDRKRRSSPTHKKAEKNDQAARIYR